MTTDAHSPSEVPDINYFVCTLGQAAVLNVRRPHAFKTVNDFFDLQAQKHPTNPAVGFPVPSEDKGADKEWEYDVYSKQILGIHVESHRANRFGFSIWIFAQFECIAGK